MSVKKLIVGKAGSIDELKFVSELSEQEGWALGQNELQCIFSSDPSGFFVGELDGKQISHIGVMKNDHFAFVSLFLVDKAYRGRGYGSQTWQAGLASVCKDCNVGLDAVEGMIAYYEKKGFQQAWIDHAYVISASSTAKVLAGSTQLAPGITIKPIGEAEFDAIFAYDTAVFGTPRHNFLETLITLPESLGFAAVNEKGGLVGYTVSEKMRREENGVRIGPLFADNDHVAQSLLQAISTTMAAQDPHGDAEITLVVPDINPAAINLIDNVLSVKPAFHLVRMFTKGVPQNMDMLKTFAITSIGLG